MSLRGADLWRLSRALRLAIVLALLLVSLRGGGWAHERSVSYSEIDWRDPEARIRARVTRLDLSRLPLDPFADGPEDPIATYVVDRLRLTRNGQPCARKGLPRRLSSPEGWAVLEWDVVCADKGPPTFSSQLFADVAPSHLHFARLRVPGDRSHERVLSDHERSWQLPGTGDPDRHSAQASETGAAGTSLLGYLLLGIGHILSGWDHLAFLAALLLLARSLTEIATLVTAFTAAHSITLALAALGLLAVNARAVEALIGFSIALVAAENAWLIGERPGRVPGVAALLIGAATLLAAFGWGTLSPLALAGLGLFSLCHFALLDRTEHPGRLRAAVAFGFGLVHGFGFAGVLGEMDLPRSRLVPALLGFNLGVEVGQLGVVLVLWPLLRLLAQLRGGRPGRVVAELGSAAICGLGLYWFVTRTYG